MNTDSTARFLVALLNLVDDFISEFRSRLIATQLIHSVATTVARCRTVQRNRRNSRSASKMCLVLEDTDLSSAWLERLERKRLSRRLEPVRQALYVADEIIEKTFSQRRPARPCFAISQAPPQNNRESRLS